MKITVYKVKADGETVGVFANNHDAEAYAYDEYPEVFGHAVNEIVPSIEDVPEVLGELLPDTEHPHVRWPCLFYGEYYDTDLDVDDTSPALCFCERNCRTDCYFLVMF